MAVRRLIGRRLSYHGRLLNGAALREPLPGFGSLEFVSKTPDPFNVEKKMLSGPQSDVHLISRPALHGNYCTIAIILGAGARHTVDLPFGVAHLDEKMAFGATLDSFKSRTEVREFLEINGGICDCQTDQESTIFALSIQREAMKEGVQLLMETVFRPDVNLQTISEALQNVDNDLKYLKYELIRDKEIVDLSCQAGYGGNTIGLKRMMPEELIAECTTQETIQTWVEHLLHHRRMNYLRNPPTFVGIGVGSEEFYESVKSNMSVMGCPTWGNSEQPDHNYLSQWTGGFIHQNEEAVNSFSIGEEISESYFCISWEAPSYNDKERAAAHVLRALLGGGRSFESGGAGKGLTTVLYRVLGSLVGQNFSAFKSYYKEFDDSGIFGIYGMCQKQFIKQGYQTCLNVMKQIEAGNFTPDQLETAKNQWTMSNMRHLEVKAQMMEDFAREAMVYGHPKRPEDIYEQIAAVSKTDVSNVAQKMMNTSVPGISILGESDGNDKGLHQQVCMAQFNNEQLVGKQYVRIGDKIYEY